MSKSLAYHDADGVLRIIHPVWENKPEGQSDEDFLAHVLARNIEVAAQITTKGEPANPHLTADTSVTVIDASTLPADRTFRDAWKHDGAAVVHDMDKAKAIHVERIRKAREPLLAALDVQVIRALGKGEPVTAIEAQKQKLRDAPADPKIAEAKTIEDLKAAWPL